MPGVQPIRWPSGMNARPISMPLKPGSADCSVSSASRRRDDDVSSTAMIA